MNTTKRPFQLPVSGSLTPPSATIRQRNGLNGANCKADDPLQPHLENSLSCPAATRAVHNRAHADRVIIGRRCSALQVVRDSPWLPVQYYGQRRLYYELAPPRRCPQQRQYSSLVPTSHHHLDMPPAHPPPPAAPKSRRTSALRPSRSQKRQPVWQAYSPMLLSPTTA